VKIGLGGALTVTATETWLSEVRAGRGFVMGGVQAAVAAQQSHVQLLNPAGSARTLIVRGIVASSGGADVLRIARHDAALATLLGAGVNLLRGGTAGLGEVRTAANAGLLGTTEFRVNILAGTPFIPVPEWYCELDPGEGMLVGLETVAIALFTNYLWNERT
jgi:hypothetical protein